MNNLPNKHNFEVILDKKGQLVEYKIFNSAGDFIGYSPSIREGWKLIGEDNRIRSEHLSRPQNAWEREAK
jgi:hypothetical protein